MYMCTYLIVSIKVSNSNSLVVVYLYKHCNPRVKCM